MSTAVPSSSLLRNSRYLRIWLGQAVSNLGDFVFDTTLVVWIAADLARGQSWAPLAVSGVLIAASLPSMLVGPFAGVFVDRWEKRHTMLWMDALRASLIVLLLLLTAGIVPLPGLRGGMLPLVWRIGVIYVVVFLAACCSQFFGPARTTLIRDVVPPEQMPQAIANGQVTLQLAVIIGPPLAAPLLFTFGPQWALLIDASSFVVSFLAILSLRVVAPGSAAQGGTSSFAAEFFAGLRFVFGSAVLRTTIMLTAMIMLGGGALNALDIFFITSILHVPATYYGVFDSVFAVGAVVGALAGGVLARWLGLTRLMWISVLALGIAIAIYSRLTLVAPALVIFFLTGMPQATLSIAIGPLIMRVTPREMLGRTSAVINPVTSAASLVSMAVAGWLASTVLVNFHAQAFGLAFGPVDSIFLAAGVLITLAGIYGSRALRGKEPATEHAPSVVEQAQISHSGE